MALGLGFKPWVNLHLRQKEISHLITRFKIAEFEGFFCYGGEGLPGDVGDLGSGTGLSTEFMPIVINPSGVLVSLIVKSFQGLVGSESCVVACQQTLFPCLDVVIYQARNTWVYALQSQRGLIFVCICATRLAISFPVNATTERSSS